MTASLPLIPLRRGAVVQLGNPAASGDPQRRLPRPAQLMVDKLFTASRLQWLELA